MIIKTPIEDLYVIKNKEYKDSRGSIREVMRMMELKCPMAFDVMQITHTISCPNVLRGLHALSEDRIIYPLSGRMFVAFADIRPSSKTFRKIAIFVLSGEATIFVPAYVAHGYYVLGKKESHYIYIMKNYYENHEMESVLWNDPDLAIPWPCKRPILSKKDKENKTMRELFPDVHTHRTPKETSHCKACEAISDPL